MTPIPQTSTWSYLGPNNTIPTFTHFGLGPSAVSGRANAVAFDPLNPSIYYVAGASGGIWKSVDKGAHWTCLSQANQYGYSFSSVVVDPTDDTTVYAGSGDYDGLANLGFGLIKFKFTSATSLTSYTVNSAVQSASAALSEGGCIRGLAIDPRNHLHLLVAIGRDVTYLDGAGSDSAIYSSTDGGLTYTNVTPGINSGLPRGAIGVYFSQIAYASNPASTAAGNQIVYASADFGGIYQSTNNGASWTKVSPNGMTSLFGFSNRMDVATSPLDVNTVYAASAYTKSIYKSTDGGTTWNNISTNLPTSDPAANDPWVQSDYDFHLTTSYATTSSTGAFGQPGSTTKTDVVYMGLLDVYQSPQGQDFWVSVLNTYSGDDLAHTDQHGMAISPFNPNFAIITNDGGAYSLTYFPSISNYSLASLNATLGITQIYAHAFGFTDPTQALLGVQDNANPHMDGNINNWVDPTSGDGSFAAINPLLYGTQYGASQFDGTGSLLSFTEDDWNQTYGQSSIPADNPPDGVPAFVPPFVMDLYNPDLLYVGQQYVWQGKHTPGKAGPPPTIGTMAWAQYGAKLTDPNTMNVDDVITALAVSQYDDNWLYASTAHGLFWYTNDKTWQRQDGFTEGTDMNGNPIFHHNNGIPFGEFTAFAASTDHPKRLFGALTNFGGNTKLYVCNDVTAGFTDMAGVWNPTCVFTSISGSGGSALPNITINSIAVIPHVNDQIIVVGTDVGVFITTNGGTSWANMGNDGSFPNGLMVNKVRYEPSTHYLYASTYGRGVWEKYMPDDLTYGPLFTSRFQLYPTLQMYRGNRAKLSMNVQFYPGLQPINGTAPTGAPPIPQPYEYDINTKLSASGWWINPVSVNGGFDVWFKVLGFLSVRMKNNQVGANTLVSPLVYAGDCNPIYNADGLIIGYGDNVIDINDVNAVLAHLGMIWTGPEDVDGDGMVTERDLEIVEANFGMVGQP